MKSGSAASIHPSRLRVLIVTQSLELGGTERQIVALANGLSRNRVDCCIFSFLENGALKNEFQRGTARIFTGGLPEGAISAMSYRILAAQWKLFHCIRETKPTILHAYLPLTTFLGAAAARAAGVSRIIISKRALNTHQDRHPPLRVIDRLANAMSHVITVNSKAVWQDTVKRDNVAPSKLRLIYNGIDCLKAGPSGAFDPVCLKTRLGIKAVDKTIINVANYIPYKGHLDLLNAAKIVLRQQPDCKFLFVGEDRGSLKSMQAAAADLGIQHRVVFLGRRKDVRELMAISDISVVASHEEGFSNAILEAMAAGLPVVATAVGGNPEAVIDGATGWVVPPKNPEALAERILALLEDPDKIREFGKRGRKRCQECFSNERMVENHIKLYRGKL
jgi:glycosyltransferase involved in cell wall biosynthesis